MHFSKVTKDDYEEEAFKKVCKIHKQLPQGGILVFLTGKKEITYMCKRLVMALGLKKGGGKKRKTPEKEDDDESLIEFDGDKEGEEPLDV
jgi:ATP-dependent RNA helicase DHX37/DHR1